MLLVLENRLRRDKLDQGLLQDVLGILHVVQIRIGEPEDGIAELIHYLYGLTLEPLCLCLGTVLCPGSSSCTGIREKHTHQPYGSKDESRK